MLGLETDAKTCECLEMRGHSVAPLKGDAR
jgi:hypothetical protein